MASYPTPPGEGNPAPDEGPDPDSNPAPASEAKPPAPKFDLGTLLILGTTLAAWMTGGVLAGRYADARLDTEPWGIVAGAILGAAGCAYSVWQAARKLES